MRPAVTISVIEMNAPPSQLFISRADSPFGRLFLASTTRGLAHLWLDMGKRSERDLRARYPKAHIIDQTSLHHSAGLSYFSNAPQPLSLNLKGTPFQLSVWRTLLQIPFARTSSYKVIAQQIGKPKANRAVGSAVSKNPVFFIIPCHRVLAHDGTLGGYYYGLEKKQEILNFEVARA
tara:strand:- start:255 stop:785 length:531 start_codon:yes stop_codon:yes gene_type:complete